MLFRKDYEIWYSEFLALIKIVLLDRLDDFKNYYNKGNMTNFDKNKNISWLYIAPSGGIDPPVETRRQVLPFEKLSWDDFERLCYRLVKLEDNYEYCTQYGIPGDRQYGIDIFARGEDFRKYHVYQCKNVRNFIPQKIKDAINLFKTQEWYEKSETFVLCTRESLQNQQRTDALEEKAKELKKDGKNIIPWDGPRLSEKLKSHPKLIDEFFGRPWVKLICGEDVANDLEDCLDAQALANLRSQLFSLYDSAFNSHDPGIPIPKSIPISQRVVIPDIQDVYAISQNIKPDTQHDAEKVSQKDKTSDSIDISQTIKSEETRFYKQRIPFQDWISKNNKSLIISEPGGGKTTLLRFLALDLLNENPVLTSVAEKWGSYLPIWIPFAMWTKMISDHGAGDPGLGGIIERWLTAWNSKHLIPLLEQALKDKRLLILIDGLDEYSDTTSAQIAINHLEQFISNNKTVSVIATTRPSGDKKLSRVFWEWTKAEIAKLSDEQQKELVYIWIEQNLKKLNPKLEDEDRKVEAEKETETFFKELARAAELRQLSGNPLLLSLLIYLQISNLRLPLSRFSAYERLVDHLISEHPISRLVAAEISKKSELTSDNVKNILANLAYIIHKEYVEGVVEESVAQEIVNNFLKDEQIGLGMDTHPANEISKNTVNVAENELGLIVKKSQTEISFYHRTLQEYLAAFHLFRLSSEEQSKIIEEYCADPQWKEVILGLFQINKRPEDIENRINIILNKYNRGSIIDQLSINVLLSEVVFGNFNCPPNLVKKLSENFFAETQNHFWLPYREKLLKNILNGLESPIIKSSVQEKIKSWFPDRAGWSRSYIFESMGNWSTDDDIIKALFIGLIDNDESVRLSAAKSLGKIAKGDGTIKKRLIKIINHTTDKNLLSSSVHSLILGWKDCSELPKIIDRMLKSPIPEHKLMAIKGKVELGIQTEEDLKIIFEIGSDRIGLYLSRPIIVEIILNGWPKSEIVKAKCLSSLPKSGYYKENELDRELALQVLLEGFPMDDQVADYCIEELENNEHPFLISSMNAFHIISKNFKGHEKLINTLDKWVVGLKHRDVEVSHAALVGRTDIFKKKLIEDLEKAGFVHWPAKALIEGWGMSDPEVSEALLDFVDVSLINASKIGHLLPKIISDKKECRRILLEALKSKDCDRNDFIIEGLLKLGNTEGDTKVVDVILPILEEDYDNFTDGLKSGLISGYNFDPRVREYALKTFEERNGAFQAVAKFYSDDKEIRDKIIKIATPLPVSMRLIIAKYLSEAETDVDYAISVLDLYDLEKNEEVKVQASIGYHSKIKETGSYPEHAIERLNKTIVCYGPDHEERRRAAFCGLVILDRLDIMVDSKERIGSERIVGIDSIRGFNDNIPHIQFVLKNWDYLREYFKNDFWERIFRYGSRSYYVWQHLAQFADKYKTPREELLNFLKENKPKIGDSNILHFLERAQPRSNILWEYCLNVVGLFKPERTEGPRDLNMHLNYRDEITAVDIIRTNFGHDEKYLEKIDIESNKHNVNMLTMLLSDVWPKSTQLKNILDEIKSTRRKCRISTIIRFYCIRANRIWMFKEIIRLIRYCVHEKNHVGHEGLYPPIVRRLQNDKILVSLLQKYFIISINSSVKISIARLLHQAVGLTPELKTKLNKELDKQLVHGSEMGFDIVSGNFVSIPQAILGMLEID